MENPFNLPPHLVGMTQAKWDAMTPREREAARDNSHLHPKLTGLEGRKVQVTPKRQFGASTFTLGKTTGWRPAHLAMRGSARGSSDVIQRTEEFLTVTVLD